MKKILFVALYLVLFIPSIGACGSCGTWNSYERSFSPAQAKNTWYVTEDGAGTKDGKSWENAIGTINGAIALADAGDLIVVYGEDFLEDVVDSKCVGIHAPDAIISSYTSSHSISTALGWAEFNMIFYTGTDSAVSNTGGMEVEVDANFLYCSDSGSTALHTTSAAFRCYIDTISASGQLIDNTSAGRIYCPTSASINCAGTISIDPADGGYVFIGSQYIDSSSTLIGYSGSNYGQITIEAHEVNVATALSNITGTNGNFVIRAHDLDNVIQLGAGKVKLDIVRDPSDRHLISNSLTLGSGLEIPVKTITSSYSLVSTDQVVIADASSSPIVITTLDATGYQGLVQKIKASDVTMTVTLDGYGTQKIDGNLTKSFAAMEGITIISDGSNWFTFK